MSKSSTGIRLLISNSHRGIMQARKTCLARNFMTMVAIGPASLPHSRRQLLFSGADGIARNLRHNRYQSSASITQDYILPRYDTVENVDYDPKPLPKDSLIKRNVTKAAYAKYIPVEDAIGPFLKLCFGADDPGHRIAEVREMVLNLKSFRNEEPEMTRKLIDSRILLACSNYKLFGLGRAYFWHTVKSSDQSLPFTVLSAAVTLFTKCGARGAVSKSDFEALVRMLQSQGDAFITLSLSHLLKATSFTDNWRECLSILEDIKKSFHVSAGPSLYSVIAGAAVRNGDLVLMREMMEFLADPNKSNFSPDDVEEQVFHYTEIVNRVDFLYQRGKGSEAMDLLSEFADYLYRTEFLLDEEVAQKLLLVLTKHDWRGESQRFPKLRTCPSCSNFGLKFYKTTEEELNSICSFILDKLGNRDRVSAFAYPYEANQFLKFMENCPSYDAVLDGPGLFYCGFKTRDPVEMLSRVTTAVKILKHRYGLQNQLVIGRHHMLIGSATTKKSVSGHFGSYRAKLDELKSLTDRFMVQNDSDDDLFALYAAAKTNAALVSRDNYRDFLATLPLAQRKLFTRWTTGATYTVTSLNPKTEHVTFREPRFRPVSLVVEPKSIHVAYKIPVEGQPHVKHQKQLHGTGYYVPCAWMCFTK